jgi:NDP-sugar pyrophosphorylase family protein
MNCTGLIMAGGRSARMRNGGCTTHKALRTICGVPLLERNLTELLRFDIKNIWIAVSESESELLSWLDSRGQAMAKARGGTLQVYIEARPLGTIGAARHLANCAENVLVFNVDNLTSLNLSSFVNFHLTSGAALTVASHDELFRIPFGQIEVNGTQLTAYHEKPEIPVSISSGIYALHRRAMQRIARTGPTDAPNLINSLLGAGEKVACYRHDSWWIDVNDEAALARAEAALSSNVSSEIAAQETVPLWRRAS